MPKITAGLTREIEVFASMAFNLLTEARKENVATFNHYLMELEAMLEPIRSKFEKGE